MRLLQLGGGDPDGGVRGDGLARLVEHLARVLVVLEAREGQPQLHVLRAALHRAREQHARVVLRGQLHRRLPEPHAVGDALKRLAQHARLGGVVLLKARGLHPQLHARGDGRHPARQHRLGVLGRLQARALQPDVLVLRAQLAPLLHKLPRRADLARELLQARGGDPPGRVVGVGLDDALKQQARLLDVADLRVRGDLHRLEVRHVPLGVHHRLPRNRVRHAVELQSEHGATPFADRRQIRHRRGSLQAAC
mmetsp:Transcript_62431/g.197832  ORF Transcript_62431/g.197832 Transcript_62431/m.197832 type:complete len:251 (-) Transcript_62431:434-1186(-)